jgi:GNAT superfamily N-acetyltransferase
MKAQVITRELSRLQRAVLERHLLTLGSEDRRLRFGLPLPDEAIRDYAERIDFERDALFGVFDDELQLSGAAHLARGESHVELGISVLSGWRGRGLGAALLARCHMRACNWAVGRLFMHCLSENAAMMHLARKQGMSIKSSRGEADAWLELPPADASSYVIEVLAEHLGQFDFALKSQRRAARQLTQGICAAGMRARIVRSRPAR